MKTIHIDLIHIDEETRQRKEFDGESLTQLANSIYSLGLLSPILLREGSILVAGERRLKAIQKLYDQELSIKCDDEPVPFNEVPFLNLSDPDDLRAYEAELAENTIRQNLSWKERVNALSELHRLRQLENPGQTDSDTAREISEASNGAIKPDTARLELGRANLLAAYVDDPIISKAKTQKEAYKLLERKVHTEFQAALSQIAVEKKTPHDLHLGTLQEIVPTLPEGSIDCIIFDPPYGMDADKLFGSASQTRHTYDDSPETAREIVEFMIKESSRICRKQANLWMFCDIALFETFRQMWEADGWTTWRYPIIWDKGAGQAHAPVGSYGFIRSYEIMIAATRGRKSYLSLRPDLIPNCPPVRNKLHAAQKPVDLYKDLITRSCYPGDVVLDPCCGSGTIFPASTQTKVKAIAIEADPAAHTIAKSRLFEE